jgi:cyclophilin family peptidyl-prolyl cis-trans isomerase
MPSSLRLVLPLLAFWSLAAPAYGDNPIVRITTDFGSFDVELCQSASTLCPAAAPIAVENFLGYVDRGDYEGTLIHRSIATPWYTNDFILQGGGFYFDGDVIKARPTQAPIVNEFNVLNGNVRGTLAMAKFGSDPDSATNQWFINLDDNRGTPPNGLDYQNGGFTVFGIVKDDGMAVVDAIAPTKPYNLSAASIIDLARPYVDPDSLFVNFTSIPIQKNPLLTTDLPNLRDYAVELSVVRVPEPGAPAGVALLALLALARRRAS